MKFLLQKLAIWFYEKMDCRSMHDSDFWSHHIFYAVGKQDDTKIIITELNRINGNLDYKGTVIGKGWFYYE
jgi:hypothetical protein